MSSSPPRVAIVHDGYVPAYRLRLYELLGELDDIEYVVFHGRKPRNLISAPAEGPFGFPNVEVHNFEIGVGRKALVYQGLMREIARGHYDAVVMGIWLRFVSNLALLPLLKVRRTPVVFWGQGFDKPEEAGRLLSLVLRANACVKGRLARVGDGYLVYTEGGRQRLVSAGLDPDRVFVVCNTLDMEEQVGLHARLRTANGSLLRAELGLRPESVVLLYVGSIYREKRLGELMISARALIEGKLTERPVELVVIGDGPELPTIKAQAVGLDGVHFRGEVRDQFEVARHMRVAAAVVCPGGVGLVVNHAFGQGRPVITRDSTLHGPEFEYIRDGENGLVVGGELAAFIRTLADFVDSPGRQRALAEGALASRDALGIERMARAFDDGVRSVLGSAPGSPAQVSANGRTARSASASASVARVDSM
jgi:glycosyltransferase involved in cell wall biosynthesis